MRFPCIGIIVLFLSTASGLAAGSFHGMREVSRLEAAVVLADLLGRCGVKSEGPSAECRDVPQAHRRAAAVAVGLGLFACSETGAFSPESSIERFAWARLMARLADIVGLAADPSSTAFLQDVPESHPDRAAAARAVECGLVVQIGGIQFAGARKVVRFDLARAAAVVIRARGIRPQGKGAPYGDVAAEHPCYEDVRLCQRVGVFVSLRDPHSREDRIASALKTLAGGDEPTELDGEARALEEALDELSGRQGLVSKALAETPVDRKAAAGLLAEAVRQWKAAAAMLKAFSARLEAVEATVRAKKRAERFGKHRTRVEESRMRLEAIRTVLKSYRKRLR